MGKAIARVPKIRAARATLATAHKQPLITKQGAAIIVLAAICVPTLVSTLPTGVASMVAEAYAV